MRRFNPLRVVRAGRVATAWFRLRAAILAIPMVLAVPPAAVRLAAAEPAPRTCFLQDGDVWVFHGDSITHADTYRRLCERVFRHHHPDADVAFVQAGVWGSASSDLVKRIREDGRRPTVVSLMLGMNNAINGGWVRGMPRAEFLEAYRKDIVSFVRKCRDEGAAVLLMSPTLADETVRRTVFRIDGANDFLVDCGRICREVAESEGCLYVPVQEEFESFQRSLGPGRRLRPDGVHPASLGEYRIARSLWERLRFSAPLGPADRRLTPPEERLPVRLRLDHGLVGVGDAVVLAVESLDGGPAPGSAIEAVWSLEGRRGDGRVDAAGADGRRKWTLPRDALPQSAVGDATEAVVVLRADGRDALFVVDLCTVPLLHFENDAISGTVAASGGAAGSRVATWTLRRSPKDLALEVDVDDDTIDAGSEWPWARDGLDLFWDFRPAGRFGGINLDDDVHQAFVNVQRRPFFAVSLRPWLGAGMEYAATAGGVEGPRGYRTTVRLDGAFGLHRPLALDQRKFVGLSLAVVDAAGGNAASHQAAPVERPRDQYANSLMVIDLEGVLPGDSVINAHVFPPAEDAPAVGEGR
ncbi:MAG: hypothetical protein EBZ59_06010 [Planctomycetia bacterium]|nr:hypothetical protein [Planctomycetia bacterium]